MLRNRREAGQRNRLRSLIVPFIPRGAAGVERCPVPIPPAQEEPGRAPGEGFEVRVVTLSQQPPGEFDRVRVVVDFFHRGRRYLVADTPLSQLLLEHS